MNVGYFQISFFIWANAPTKQKKTQILTTFASKMDCAEWITQFHTVDGFKSNIIQKCQGKSLFGYHFSNSLIFCEQTHISLGVGRIRYY